MKTFNHEKTNNILKIDCPSTLNAEVAKDFSDQAKSWLLTPVMHFVIDYKNVVSISREFYQSLLHLKSNLKKDQKHLHALNLSMELLKQIKADGIESAFHLIKSLDSLIAEEKSLAKKNNTLNVDFINPFLLATKKP